MNDDYNSSDADKYNQQDDYTTASYEQYADNFSKNIPFDGHFDKNDVEQGRALIILGFFIPILFWLPIVSGNVTAYSKHYANHLGRFWLFNLLFSVVSSVIRTVLLSVDIFGTLMYIANEGDTPFASTGILSILIWLITIAYSIAAFVVWLIYLIGAIQGEYKEPIVFKNLTLFK